MRTREQRAGMAAMSASTIQDIQDAEYDDLISKLRARGVSVLVTVDMPLPQGVSHEEAVRTMAEGKRYVAWGERHHISWADNVRIIDRGRAANLINAGAIWSGNEVDSPTPSPMTTLRLKTESDGMLRARFALERAKRTRQDYSPVECHEQAAPRGSPTAYCACFCEIPEESHNHNRDTINCGQAISFEITRDEVVELIRLGATWRGELAKQPY